MIELLKVTKSFDDVLALAELDMKVPQGAVYGLVGPNGAGKTTALHHISGAMKPDSGDVLVDGEPVFENIQAKAKIACIPSDLYFYGQATIDDMRALHEAVFPGFESQRFEKLASVFDMDINKKMRSLSKGMQKQVAFWLALSQRPQILLLDEPVDGLDPTARHTIWGLVMEEVAERGMTVLVSSHNLRELTDVCDYVGIMQNGRMHTERALCELQDNFVKVQVAFEDVNQPLPEQLDVLSHEVQGRLHTLVVRANASRAQEILSATQPVFTNVLPLSLEEIFIHEMGGANYEGILS